MHTFSSVFFSFQIQKLYTLKYTSNMKFTPKLARRRSNWNPESTKIFGLKVKTLEHWASHNQLRLPGFFSYDLSAWRYRYQFDIRPRSYSVRGLFRPERLTIYVRHGADVLGMTVRTHSQWQPASKWAWVDNSINLSLKADQWFSFEFQKEKNGRKFWQCSLTSCLRSPRPLVQTEWSVEKTAQIPVTRPICSIASSRLKF